MPVGKLLPIAFAAVCLLATSGANAEGPRYEMRFEARVVPTQRVAEARWVLGVGADAVREVTLRIDPKRHTGFTGSGSVEVDGTTVVWKPPRRGGTLKYQFRIDDVRGDGGYDARCSDDWALFRGDDLFPPARTRTIRGAESVSVLKLRLPTGWSSATRFTRSGTHVFEVDDPSRRFDRPTGWIAVGRLGVLRETVAGSRVAVAGPVGHGVRRHDMLAFLRWNLPAFRSMLGELPERLLVVSAGDPMWRGGLSGPSSLFVHADRPLITNDASSPLLHELFHSTTRLVPGPDGDWIVEGLAEYYSIELMRRARTISRGRARRALERIETSSAGVPLRGETSEGAATDRAVTVFRALNARIKDQTDGKLRLDVVVRALVTADEPVTTQRLRARAEEATELDLGSFFRNEVPEIVSR